MAEPTVTIPLADYERLLLCAELDDMIVTCEVCGAWMDRADPALATIDDVTGCRVVGLVRAARSAELISRERES
jgi:hypothetical protein